MGFSSTRLAVENQRAPRGDELQPQVGAEQRLPQRRLQTKVELVNGLEEGEMSLAGKALQARLFAMRHFFGQQKSKKITIAPVFFLGSIRHVLVDTPFTRRNRASSCPSASCGFFEMAPELGVLAFLLSWLPRFGPTF